ncbi:MAG: hypothetical protein WC500_06080 [Candidatus Margulisiibacteriota bacterium]
MQKILINQLVIPSFEVAARVVSNLSVLQLWTPYITIVLTAGLGIFAYLFTQRWPQEKAIKIAIKYEIYHNFYQMIDCGYCAKHLLINHQIIVESGLKPGGAIIYCEPYYIAFEAMMRNGLMSAFKNREDALFSLYESIREYDSTYRFWVEKVNNPEKVVNIPDVLKKIVGLAEQQEKKLSEYFDKLDFISKEGWDVFKAEGKKIWNRE